MRMGMVQMNKYRVFADPLKEEKWINDVQQQGYRLVENTLDFIYTFEETNEEYVTRIDYQEHMSKIQFDEYVSIHEEFGWQHIRGGRFGMTEQIWSKVADGNDELFSDRHSRINYYKRYAKMTGSFAVLFLVYSMLFLPDNSSMIFLTPGLWEMQGMEFWRAFLFELPFALLRVLPAVLFPILAIMFLLTYSQMNKAKKELEMEE